MEVIQLSEFHGEYNPRSAARLEILGALVIQREIGREPISLRKVLGGDIAFFYGEKTVQEALDDLTYDRKVLREHNKLAVTNGGNAHFYHRKPEKKLRQAIIAALAVRSMSLEELRRRTHIRNACIEQSDINVAIGELEETGIVYQASPISNIMLTGRGLLD